MEFTTGNLKGNYVEIDRVGGLLKDLAVSIADRRATAIVPAKQLVFYAKDPLNTAPIPAKITDAGAALKTASEDLTRLGTRMEAIAEGLRIADELDLKPNWSDPGMANLDPESWLTSVLMEHGHIDVAMEANLFDPGDSIEYGLTLDAEGKVWRFVEAGTEVEQTIKIQLLDDGSYQMAVGMSSMGFGAIGVKLSQNGKGEVKDGKGYGGTIIFRSDDASAIDQNLTDIGTLVFAPAEVPSNTAKGAGREFVEAAREAPWYVPPIFHLDDAAKGAAAAAKIEEERVTEAAQRLWEDWDAIEVELQTSASGSASTEIELVVFGDEKLSEFPVGFEAAGTLATGASVAYQFNRDGDDQVKVRGQIGVQGGASLIASPNATEAPVDGVIAKLIEAKASAGAKGSGSVAVQATIDVATGDTELQLQAQGDAGVELAQALGVEQGPKSVGVDQSASVTKGYEFTASVALEGGSFPPVAEPEIEINEVHTAERNHHAQVDIGVGEVNANFNFVNTDVEPVYNWEPGVDPPPPAVEPPAPDFDFDITLPDPEPLDPKFDPKAVLSDNEFMADSAELDGEFESIPDHRAAARR